MEKVRFGIFGAGRGSDFIKSVVACGGEVVAVCDLDKGRQKSRVIDKVGDSIKLYDDFDSFIEHDMDAVIVANYFHEHASYAIRCLEKNIHVLSECTAAGTMAECVALVRAAEKSKAMYMLCENYPYMIFNQELRKIVQGGTLGDILYAEGEYNHPSNPENVDFVRLCYDSSAEKHWRLYLPRTYYITHSMAPLMLATGKMPKRVTAMPVAPFNDFSQVERRASHVKENAAIITTMNEDGSVYRVTGHSNFGVEVNSYRFCGRSGQVENLRGDESMISLNYNPWEIPEGGQQSAFYKAVCDEKYAEQVKNVGHCGGDFFVIKEFIEHVQKGKKHTMDEHFATTLSAVAILGHRSLLEGGVPYDIPDFRKEEDRKKYENDNLSPFYYSDGREPNIPCTYDRDYKPTEAQVEAWKKWVFE